MDISFFLPTDSGMFLGFNADARAPVVPRLVPGTADGGHAFVALGSGGSAEASVNVHGIAIALDMAAARPLEGNEPEPGAREPGDALRAALATASTAEGARDAIVAMAERCLASRRVPLSRARLHAMYLIMAADGAYRLETAGRRWAWKSLDYPDCFAGSYALDDDYKRVDAATRKAIAPVNERMACLDEADPGRVGSKESWRVYVEARGPTAAGEFRRRALLPLLAPAAQAGTRAAAFALLRAHRVPDLGLPLRHRDACGHGGPFGDGRNASSMLVELDRATGALTAWFTAAPLACANLFKPVPVVDGRFVPLWDGLGMGEPADATRPVAYWSARRAALSGAAGSIGRAEARAGALAEAQATVAESVDAYRSGNRGPGPAAAIARAVADWDAAKLP